ncbi:MAG: spore cortex biosynthesis protein YabQ [Lachnospiraceae bacterium]|nr:spore cortex biosynthesis protein YabQ [Lachnospiraceae bacterium]
MNEIINNEWHVFLVCVVYGYLIVFIYDLIRIIRIITGSNRNIIFAEDVCFGIFAGFKAFGIIQNNNSGILRGFIFFSYGIGMILYITIFSKALVSTAKSVIISIKSFINQHIKAKFKRRKADIEYMEKNG